MTAFTESIVEEAAFAWLAVNQCPAAERRPDVVSSCLGNPG